VLPSGSTQEKGPSLRRRAFFGFGVVEALVKVALLSGSTN
jgi:hypothetical protein